MKLECAILFQRGLSDQKSGHDPFLTWTILYQITRLLAKFGVKKTALAAWVGAQPLFLAQFGIDSARAPSPQNPTSVLLSRCSIDIGCWSLGLEGKLKRVSFWPILAPICWSFYNPNTHISSTAGPFHSNFFRNDVWFLWGYQNTSKHVIWCSEWSGVDIWLWKVGFVPRPIRHGLRYG